MSDDLHLTWPDVAFAAVVFAGLVGLVLAVGYINHRRRG